MNVNPQKLQEVQEYLLAGRLDEIQLVLDELLNSDEICECAYCYHLFDKKDAVSCTRLIKKKRQFFQNKLFCGIECMDSFCDSIYDYDGVEYFIEGI